MKVRQSYLWGFVGLCLASWLGISEYLARTPDPVLRPDTGFSFPLPSEIVRMSAIEIAFRDPDAERSFDVPKHWWPEILAAMRPSESVDLVGSMTVEGQLKIGTLDGKESVVVLYSGPKRNLWFSLGYTDYYHTASPGPFLTGDPGPLFRVLGEVYRESDKK